MCSVGTLLAFVLVCIGVIVLRRTNPDLPRSFRSPLVPLVPALGALTCLLMMVYLPTDTRWRLAIWMAVGLVFNFFYGRRHSKLNRTNGQ